MICCNSVQASKYPDSGTGFYTHHTHSTQAPFQTILVRWTIPIGILTLDRITDSATPEIFD